MVMRTDDMITSLNILHIAEFYVHMCSYSCYKLQKKLRKTVKNVYVVVKR